MFYVYLFAHCLSSSSSSPPCKIYPETGVVTVGHLSRFSTTAGIVFSAAFYAGVGLVAISLGVSILLASSTLWYVCACARGFKENNPVLDGCQIVDFLVVFAGCKSMKNRFNGSFVCRCLKFVIFLTSCPRSNSSVFISSVSVV
jgi:hypothetical protein